MSTVETIATPHITETDQPMLQEISLNKIKPSKANPRRRMDETALAELSANIKKYGVLQPILVHPVTEESYEIVCGERRWRASKTAHQDTIPARIVRLGDAEALELAVIENVQREDIHELDEAFGYKALMKEDPPLYTVETIAAKVGRTPRYVYGRLKLAELTPNVQKAFYESKLTAGHAMEIARLQPKDQEQALRECFPEHSTVGAVLKDKAPRSISVRDLRNWIEQEIHLSLANAPFDVKDPNLVPAAGACSTCPKRSGGNPLLFADNIKRADICTDPACFKVKRDALVQLRINEVRETGAKPVKVSDSALYYGSKPLPGVLYRPDYQEVKAGECPTTTAAVVIEGRRAGTKLQICTDKKCKVHCARSVGPTEQEKAERKKQRQALRIQQEYRIRLLEAIRERVPAPLSRHELDLVGRRYFEQLGHDSQQRIFKFFAWEAAKPNGAGHAYVDFPSLAGERIKAMSPAEIGRFLVVCALASELYCPPYVSTTLGKDSKLVREAAHYKVNAAGILQELCGKLEQKSAKHNGQEKSRDEHKKTRRTNKE